MKSYIIGIAGQKRAGKDTVAGMIDYIFKAGVSKANFADYLKYSIDKTKRDRIIHFADNLKQCLSIIYNIPLEYFYDDKIKENGYYNFTTGKIMSYNDINKNEKMYYIITNDNLNSMPLSSYIYNLITKYPVISIRTLMQYFGTNICRKYLSDFIWINSTISKAIDIAISQRLCIIADVRFANEAQMLDYNDEYLYRGVIEVSRFVDTSDSHQSEIIDFDTNYIINNNSTKKCLFYRVLDVVQKIIKL